MRSACTRPNDDSVRESATSTIANHRDGWESRTRIDVKRGTIDQQRVHEQLNYGERIFSDARRDRDECGERAEMRDALVDRQRYIRVRHGAIVSVVRVTRQRPLSRLASSMHVAGTV
jgi:hypothetical protein